MTARRASARSPAYMAAAEHRRLWRMVEGAVVDAFMAHPDYLTAKGAHSAVESITKRVVGNLVGHAKGTREAGGDPETGGRCLVDAVARGGTAHLPGATGGNGRGQGTAPGHVTGDGP